MGWAALASRGAASQKGGIPPAWAILSFCAKPPMVRAMTALGKAATAHGKALAARAIWRAEMIDTIRLAAPMALTQLGQISMMTTDLMLLGRLGDKVVAAAALAHTVLFVGFTLGMGFMQAVAPLAAQAFGARQPRMVRRALRVGLWASLMLGV